MTQKGDFSGLDLENPTLPDWVKDNALTNEGYPYDARMKRKAYEKQLVLLQLELLKLQNWVDQEQKRVVMVFEGRDSAGKGGTIKRFMEHLNPRKSHVVALGKPTDVEQGQWYFQRYISHLPTKGEMALFDRSWYNRAGVEKVLGFCSDAQYDSFMGQVPSFEKQLVDDGIYLFKFWLNVGRETQFKRFHDRRHDPLKVWKLSPIDIKSLPKWGDYTAVRHAMFEQTHTDHAPWTAIRAHDKRRSRLEAMRHVLSQIDYTGRDLGAIGQADDKIIGQGAGLLV